MPTWIVAYDFSDHAREAFDRAAVQLAGIGGGTMILLYAHQPATTVDGGVDLSLFGVSAEAERAYLADLTQKLRAAGDEQRARHPTLTIEARVETGRPADVVVDAAGRAQASLIVVGSHGRRGFQRFFLGSVAEQILRKADCSVLVVKQATH